ncbi:hypothetical protein ABFP37_09305 [Burkholderia sp. RS01]|uniref:hypothetical protein n=1 Tax=Burkholderia sp. RS01 TaxID=3139774 RepID=UPI00321825A1
MALTTGKDFRPLGGAVLSGQALALSVDLEVAESAYIEPVAGGSLHESQKDAVAGTAAHNDSRGVGIDCRLPEDPDGAAVFAPSDRCDDVDAEQFPQRPCRSVSVQMRYRITRDSGDVIQI